MLFTFRDLGEFLWFDFGLAFNRLIYSAFAVYIDLGTFSLLYLLLRPIA